MLRLGIVLCLVGCTHDRGLNWSQGSLRDAAADGCPDRYSVWAITDDGTRWLIGCWGWNE